MLSKNILLKLLIFFVILAIPCIGLADSEEEIAQKKNKKSIFLSGLDLTKSEFSSETRMGVSYSTGNTSSIVLNGGSDTKYRYKRLQNVWSLGARYERIFSSSTGTSIGTTAHYIYGIYRLDYYLKPYLSTFAGGGVYTNKIKGIAVAGEGFGGLQFLFIKTENTDLAFSVGYDYTYENRLRAANKEIHSATQELNFEQKLNSLVKLTGAIRVLESVQNGRDVRVDAKTALYVKINDHLSIIVGFKLLFSNEPTPGYRKLDTYSDLSLGITF